MPRILANDGMDKGALEQIRGMGIEVVTDKYSQEELLEQIKQFDAIVVRSATKVTKAVLDASLETKQLQLVIRAGVGLDNVDVAHAENHGITVRNTPNSASVSVAELAIGHMFALAKHIHHANVTMREGKWLKSAYSGIELEGKTLGLIGFGRIAQVTARKAQALGMKVIYTDILGKIEGLDAFAFVSKEELLKTADFVSLHIPFDKEAGATIGAKEFAMMKDGVYLINCARGGTVCETALLEALDSGKVAAAALDVFEEEPTKNQAIYTHEKISLTPHIGASTKEAQEKIGAELVAIVEEFFKK